MFLSFSLSFFFFFFFFGFSHLFVGRGRCPFPETWPGNINNIIIIIIAGLGGFEAPRRWR